MGNIRLHQQKKKGRRRVRNIWTDEEFRKAFDGSFSLMIYERWRGTPSSIPIKEKVVVADNRAKRGKAPGRAQNL